MRQPSNSTSWWGNPVLYGPDMTPPFAPRMAPPMAQPTFQDIPLYLPSNRPPPPPPALQQQQQRLAGMGTPPRPAAPNLNMGSISQPPPMPQSPFGPQGSSMPPPLSSSWGMQAQNPPGEMMPSSQRMAPPPLEIGQRGGNPFPPFPEPSYARPAPPPQYEPQQMYVPAGATFQYDPAIHGPTNNPEPLDPELGPYQGRSPYEPPWGGGYIFRE